MGLVVALEPADKPTRGIVVVAPGAAGLDAAAIAADVLTERRDSARCAGAPPIEPLGAAPQPPVQRRSTRSAQYARRDGPAISVVRFDLEDYIARVLAGEGSRGPPTRRSRRWRSRRARSRWPIAIAIAAKATTSATPRIARSCARRPRRRAARPQATAGRVLAASGPAGDASSTPRSCGGTSELASDVWPGAVDYVVRPHRRRGVRGRAGVGERSARRSDRAGASRRRAIAAIGCAICACVQRNASGRVARLRVEGFTPAEMSRPRLPHGGRPRRRMAAHQEHGVRRAPHRHRVIASRPRLRPWRRAVRDRRRAAAPAAGARPTRSCASTFRRCRSAASRARRPRPRSDASDAAGARQPADARADVLRCACRRAKKASAHASSNSSARARDADCARRRASTAPAVDPRDGASDRRSVRPRDRAAVVGVGRDRRHRRSICCRSRSCGSAASSSARSATKSRTCCSIGAAERPAAVGARRRRVLLCRSRRAGRSAARRVLPVRRTTSSCGRSPPARTALPTRAPKRASGARSRGGKRWSDIK